jgi:voltage-dependent calcium channel T type alpha-1G
MGFVFSVVFTIEAGIKIFALGFVCGRKTYLKSYWNVLDFIIVIAGIIEIVMQWFEV